MSDLNSLNDPELDDLVRHLSAVKLSPTARQREQLLYSCGRAAGRAEVGRRLRRMYVATASLTCVAVSLAYVQVTGVPRPPRGIDPQMQSVAEQPPRDPPIDTEPQRQPAAPSESSPQLTVGTSYEEMLSLSQNQSTELAHTNVTDLTSDAVLTPISRPHLDDLWN